MVLFSYHLGSGQTTGSSQIISQYLLGMKMLNELESIRALEKPYK